MCHRFNTVTWLSIKFFTNPVGCRKAQAVAMARMTSYLVQKPCTSNFDYLFSFLQQFQYCHMTQHQTFYKLRELSWSHKPSLWKQWRHILSESDGQAILTLYSPLCHSFNTVTWLSIKLSTNPEGFHSGTSRRYGNNDVLFGSKSILKQFWPLFFVGHRFNTVTSLSIKLFLNPFSCHGGTNHRYGNNDVKFCPKTMAKQFWSTIVFCATVAALSIESTSTSPLIQWVAQVAQAVAMATTIAKLRHHCCHNYGLRYHNNPLGVRKVRCWVCNSVEMVT